MDSCDGCDILGALLLVAHDDGDLDDDDLLVLAAMVEFASARGLLRIDFSLYLGDRLHLSSLDGEICLSRFRFTRKQIEELMIGMQIPDEFRSPCRTKWFGLDGLLIVLRRLPYPARLADLVSEFGRSEAVLSLIFNTMLGWIWTRWGHVLSNPFAQPYFTASRIAIYARAVRQKSFVNLDVWGFIDGTVRPICRPGLHQQMFFNGHKRIHALKFQIVTTPDGLIAHAFGPVEGCRHDAGVLGESGLLPLLQQNMNGPGGVPYALYGDAAYPLSGYIQKGFQGAAAQAPHRQLFNSRMSKVRQAVEWSFGEINSLWSYNDMRKQQRLLLQPVALHYGVSILLTNARTILRMGNKTSDYFKLSPPTIHEYFQ